MKTLKQKINVDDLEESLHKLRSQLTIAHLENFGFATQNEIIGSLDGHVARIKNFLHCNKNKKAKQHLLHLASETIFALSQISD